MAETVPVFPLGTVLMPGALLPLHIFEPRYRQLTIDLVTGAVPDKEFGVVAVREGWTPDEDGIEGLHSVGCTAALRDVRRLPDGRFDIVTRGARRFRLLELDTESKPYLMGSVEFLPDTGFEGGDDLTSMLTSSARDAHRRYCDTAWKTDDWSEPDAAIPADELPAVLAADCLLPLADKQGLLEQASPTERLRMVRLLLARETGLLTQLRAVPAPLTTFSVEHSAN
ncbi:LON peptidase substrate-binding domain-containing protein [Pseudonocardia hydrocarbonoxydans]|uniref:Peptidase n=1 Tax=Pseudonocardia hydrocarbonoxydans TaxID=76726 RepID=A0A4Y3WMH4_9PSEU|nr:LON peptidase substrate-binding domain-containing protein [Pseudonocardia hydrocarbonoxydans]GEC18536.1 peptidase [Pseudonocardia hydrocarbonoxydans]